MMYSYSTLCRRAVLATLDFAARNIGLLRTHHWLSDPRNVLTLWLDAPAYQQHPGTVAPALPLSNEERMQAWSVCETVRFFEEEDLTGPAKLLRASGVRGVDLLLLTAQTLVRDVGLTRFAARRAVEARDLFLQGDHGAAFEVLSIYVALVQECTGLGGRDFYSIPYCEGGC